MNHAEKKSKGTSLEKCSFVCHFLTLPLGILYILWVLIPEENLEEWHVTYYPRKEWSVHVPVALLSFFFAAPLIYAALNSLSVPSIESIHTLRDDFSRKPTTTATSLPYPQDSSVPEICDLDPATLRWYPYKPSGKRR